MVRVGGMSYAIAPLAAMGSRINDMTTASGEPVDPERQYVVAGWASVNEDTEGPPIWDVMEDYFAGNPVVTAADAATVKVRM